MSTAAAPAPASSQPLQKQQQQPSAARVCTACRKPVADKSMRALGRYFHIECFICAECGLPCEKFFPFYEPDDVEKVNLKVLCETHYFGRHGLLCDKCGLALRGPHINALGKKFHLEHFCCSHESCNLAFRQHDLFYERDGKIYCQEHFYQSNSAKCGGCQMAVVHKFVEMRKEGVVYQWHPQCYMLYKLWNVKSNFQSTDESSKQGNMEDSILQRLETIDNIISVLKNFEESTVNCIQGTLEYFSANKFSQAVLCCSRFLDYVDALFLGLERIDSALIKAGGPDACLLAPEQKETKHLTKRTVRYFSTLKDAGTDAGNAAKEVLKGDLIDTVTELANSLKTTVRLALHGAFRMERDFGSESSIVDFLTVISSVPETSILSASEIFEKLGAIMDDQTDFCVQCKKTVNHECFKTDGNTACWSTDCFHCQACGKVFDVLDLKNLAYNEADGLVYCLEHAVDNCVFGGIRKVSQLQQFSFLLHFALGKVYAQLSTQESFDANVQTDAEETVAAVPQQGTPIPESPAPATTTLTNRMPHLPPTDDVPASDDDMAHAPALHRELEQLPRLLTVSSVPVAPPLAVSPSTAMSEKSMVRLLTNVDAASSGRVLSEQSALERIGIERQAVALLEKIMGRKLVELTGTNGKGSGAFGLKGFSWKFRSSAKEAGAGLGSVSGSQDSRVSGLSGFVNGNGTAKRGINLKAPMKVGTFGVPLADLVATHGVVSQLPGNLSGQIPKCTEVMFQQMYQMDVSVEGIFRKNGNIRRLKEMAEMFDQNPDLDKLDETSVIQVAALLKRFLRELPDPLLTSRLHPLFVESQNPKNNYSLEQRKKILHLLCCLLPKPNSDLLQLLLQLLRYVSQFKESNMMDIPNLSTVISPNILYAKGKDVREDHPFLCITAVQMLIFYQDEFRMVPDEIVLNSNE
ncbi:hypothetical protein HDU84_003126 [Entophlyctis sp. JEL0112]|nr:hypothetical protein HDU84_003126 [Entophlyctis sp. JEL0112]